MAVNVNTNVSAMTAQRFVNSAASQLNTSMERLSSGSKINSAKDDASGLQISNRLNVQNRGLDIAVRNANDGISMAQIAEGALSESTDILQRMRDLSLQSANGSNSKAERVSIQEEITTLNDELNRIAETTSFAGIKLLNGTFGNRTMQIGADSGEGISLSLNDMRTDNMLTGGTRLLTTTGEKGEGWTLEEDSMFTMTLQDKFDPGNSQEYSFELKGGDDIQEIATRINGQQDAVQAMVDEDGNMMLYHSARENFDLEVSGDFADEISPFTSKDSSINDIDVTTVGGAQLSVSIIDSALKYVDSNRAELGAFENRLDHAITNLENIDEKIHDSKSQIKDTDFAKETTEMTKSQILQQSSTSILAQAKQKPNAALGLLG